MAKKLKQPAHQAHIVAITNQKGGVAKTTTCINLAAGLVAINRKVLVVDMDPQANATVGSGIEKKMGTVTIYDVLMKKKKPTQAIVPDTPALYDLLPSNRDLTAAEIELITGKRRPFALRSALASLRTHYNYIMIDCPPSLNILTINSMGAADSILVPIQCEYFALRGLTELMRTVEGVKATINSKLEFEGILRTMYDKRNRLAREVSHQLLQSFASEVYNVIIPRNVRLAEAPSHGLPAVSYDRRSVGAITYLALAGEFVRRHEER